MTGTGNWFYFSRKERWAIITLIIIVTLLCVVRWIAPHTSSTTNPSSPEMWEIIIADFEKQLKPIPKKTGKKKEKKASKPTEITVPAVQRMGNVNDVEKEFNP